MKKQHSSKKCVTNKLANEKDISDFWSVEAIAALYGKSTFKCNYTTGAKSYCEFINSVKRVENSIDKILNILRKCKEERVLVVRSKNERESLNKSINGLYNYAQSLKVLIESIKETAKKM